MARKDVIDYYFQIQEQYFEMVGNVKDLQEALKGKHIDQEQFEAAQKEIEILKNNYERIAFIIMLLNKPQRKYKQTKEEKQNKEIYEYLKDSSTESIKEENKNALKELKRIIKEIKKDDN